MNPLRELIAFFDVDTSGVEEGVKKSQGLIGKLTSDLKGLAAGFAGAFAVKSLFDFGKAILAETEATSQLATALGMGAEQLQGWRHAADMTRVGADVLTSALGSLRQATVAAAAGQGGAASAFKRLGVEIRDAERKVRPAGDVLGDVLEQLEGIGNKARRDALLLQLFGAEGKKLVPLLDAGKASVEQLRAEVEQLGFGITDEFAADTKQFHDEITRIKLGFRGLMVQGLTPLLPALTDFASVAVGVLKGAAAIAKEFSTWVRETRYVHAVLGVLTMKHLPALVGYLGKAVLGVGGLRGAFMRLLPFLWKVVAPMLILEDLFVFFAGGQSAFGSALEKVFGEGTAEKFRDTVLEILTALKDGEIGKALTKSLEGAGAMFGAIGDLMLKGFIKLWNAIVERSGRLGELMGLEKIEEGELDVDRESSYERARRQAEKLRSGEETEEERQQREARVPGAAELNQQLRDLGIGALNAAGQPGAPADGSMLVRNDDGTLAIQRLAEAAENLQAVADARQAEAGVTGPASQDVHQQLAINNRIQVMVQAREEDIGRRVATATARGVRDGIDTNALLAALVPQPAR